MDGPLPQNGRILLSRTKEEHNGANSLCPATLGYVLSPDEKPPCLQEEYRTESGICCNKCFAGSRFVAPCVAASHRTTCESCPMGQYTEHMNFTPNCRSCKRCKGPKPLHVAPVVGIGLCVLVVMLLAVGLITYTATKRHTKSKLVAKREASEAPKATPKEEDKMLIHSEVCCSRQDNMALPCVQLSEQELTKLPDCIPLEINIPGLIYSVLDLVPATRVKELARGLGVMDVEIERVGLDHRICKEAHYQMLRVWAERETRGGGVLHRPLIQVLLDRLGDMHLGGAVEELET
ncbi:hypothetical protein CRUP_027849, partial [Coryphaenoides rupestris]